MVEEKLSLIDWDCSVKVSKNTANLGLRRNVKLNIDWLFSENEQGIILEDDVRFEPGLFDYFKFILDNYSNDKRIGAISGNNLVRHQKKYPLTKNEPFLCSIFHCWGWATWHDRWQNYNDAIEQDDDFFDNEFPNIIKNKEVRNFWLSVRKGLQADQIDSWAWRMQLSLFKNQLLCVTPPNNLATNVGFDNSATHTSSAPEWLKGWKISGFLPPRLPPNSLEHEARFDVFENEIILGATMSKSLDLGCGRNPKNIFNADSTYGIDIREDIGRNIYKADLAVEPLPFEDNFFDYITAHDFLEHIPRLLYVPNRRYPFIELMNEIYRTLKMNGTFLSFTPAYPHAEAFRDPTHVNIISEQTFMAYFDDTNRWGEMYGFNGAFKVVSQEWRGPHLLSILQKVPVPNNTLKL
jgi:hypothetical protein